MTLDELKRLYAEATPGPWHAISITSFVRGSKLKEYRANANLVLEMHAALPKLIAVAEATQHYMQAYDNICVPGCAIGQVCAVCKDHGARVDAVKAALDALEEP